jgi:hypothetical protein
VKLNPDLGVLVTHFLLSKIEFRLGSLLSPCGEGQGIGSLSPLAEHGLSIHRDIQQALDERGCLFALRPSLGA